jgi:hypothetical protein
MKRRAADGEELGDDDGKMMGMTGLNWALDPEAAGQTDHGPRRRAAGTGRR